MIAWVNSPITVPTRPGEQHAKRGEHLRRTAAQPLRRSPRPSCNGASAGGREPGEDGRKGEQDASPRKM